MRKYISFISAFIILFFFSIFPLLSQTTYTWIGASGASWAVSTNWSPTRTTPAANDVILFNSGTTLNVIAVPTQTIRSLTVTNNSNINLTGASGAIALSIGGVASTNNLLIEAGSTLQITGTGTSLTLRYNTTANQFGSINGTLIINALGILSTTATTSVVTVNNGGAVINNRTGAGFTSSATTLLFASGSAYNDNYNGAATIPTAGWDASSTVNINSGTATISGFGQTFGNVNINPASAGTITMSGTPATVAGNLSVLVGTLSFGGVTVNVKGDVINNATINTSTVNSKLTLNGTVLQTVSGAGVWTTGTAGRILNLAVDNSSGQNPSVIINPSLVIQTSLTLTNGIVDGPGTITLGIGAAGTLTMTRVSGSLANTPTFNLTGVTYSVVYGNGVAVPQITTGVEIPYFPSTISGTFTVNNPTNGIMLGGSISLVYAGAGLVMTNGSIMLGNNDLILGGTTTISGVGSATKMVIADAASGYTGQFKKTFNTGATAAFTFPVGDISGSADYSPFAITFSANSAIRTIGVIVNDNVHPQMNSNGSQTDYVTRYWTLTDNQAGVGTYTYSAMSLTYSTVAPSDVNGTTANYRTNRWTGSEWSQQNSTVAAPTVTTSQAFTETTGPLGGSDFTLRNNPAQTFTWLPTSGSASWVVATNWSPSRITPCATDKLLFNQGGSSIATNIITETENQILISNNTNITFNSAAAATLSINGATLTDNISISIGSVLTLGATVTLTYLTTANQRGDISGTLNVNAGGTFNTSAVVTTLVTVTGTLAKAGGTITSSAATLSFAAGSYYNHAMNGGTVVTATWDAASNCNITGITSTNLTSGLTGTFGNLIWNTISQTATGAINGALTLGGSLTVTSGTINLSGQNVNVAGDVSNNGTINTTTASSKITMNGNSSQTISGSGVWTTGTAGRLLNLAIANTSGLNPAVNINSSFAIQTSLTLTSGMVGGSGTLTLGIGAASTLTMTRVSGSLLNTPVFNLTGVTFNAVYGNAVAVANIVTGPEIPYDPITFNNFQVNNPTNGVTLSNHIKLGTTGVLTLTAGNLYLGNYNFTITNTAAAAVSGGSVSSFVVADATGGNTGQLIRSLPASTGTYAFPVGDATGTAEYSPVSLNFTANNTARSIGVKVTDDQHPDDGSSTDYITRYWTFTDAAGGTYTYTPTFTFVVADLVGTYANMFLNRCNSGIWTQTTNSGVSPNLTTAGLTNVTGLLSGSDFTGRVSSTIYVWNQTGTADWTVASNWTPNRTIPSTTDILQFNNGATTTATNVPTQTIKQLSVFNSTNISLQSGAAVTLSINGPTLTNNLSISSGSTLQLSSTAANSINLTIVTTVSQRADISGTLILNTNTSNNNTFTTTAVGTTVATVSSSGVITNNGGTVTSSAATLVFANSATYNHNRNAGAVPTATWTNSSPFPVCNITSATTGPASGVNQNFGDFIVNSGASVTTALNGATQINGILNLTSGILSIGANTLTLNGDLSVSSGSITGGTTSSISVTGTAANLSLPTIANNLQNLVINRANGVTLTAPLSLSTSGILTLTSGILTTSSTDLLTINNTAVGGVSGGSASSYVFGPLARALPASLATGSTYTFPVGKAVYNLFELVNPTTGVTGTVTVEVFDANSGGTAGFGLSALNTNRYWLATPSSGFVTSSTIRITEPSMGGANRVAQSATQNGTYVSRGGTAPSPILSNPIAPALNYFVLGTGASVTLSGTYTVGASGQFLKLTDVANILNSSTVTGDVIFELLQDYDGTVGETFPIIFNQFAMSKAPWSATVRPASGVSSMLTTSGTTASAALITFNGIARLTFDGRPDGSGTMSDIKWTITNKTDATSYPTIQFIGGANLDNLQYMSILGSPASTTGNILFSTGGNNHNIISYSNIGNYSSYQCNGILASSSSGVNSDIQILNNNIYNFKGGRSSPGSGFLTNAAICVTSNNSGSNWTISGNSIYATTIPIFSYFVAGISFNAGNTSTGNVISGNYIGGNAPLATGTMSYKGHVGYNDILPQDFTGIYVNAGGTTTVSDNTISNINLDVSTNNIGSQTFCGINVDGTVTGNTYNVTGNLVGGPVCDCIHAGQYGSMLGIYNSSKATTLIDGNTVANITSDGAWPNGTWTYDGVIGIYAYNSGQLGPNTITNNVVYGLTSANNYRNNLYIPIPAGGSSYNTSPIYNMILIGGIVLNTSYSSSVDHSISFNQVYNLKLNMTGGTNKAYIEGIVMKAGPYGTNTIDGNTVYDLWYPDGFGGSGNYGGIVGIDLPSGNGSSPGANYYVKNNMIHLGLKPDGTTVKNVYIFGIWDDNTTNNTGWLHYYIYNNSVYIGGTNDNTGGNNLSSYGIARYFNWSSAAYESLNIRNNVIVNNRTTTAGTGKNYGIYLLNYNSYVNVTCDYNDIYGTGTNFYTGSVGNGSANVDYTTLAAWQAATPTAFDGNSLGVDPLYQKVTIPPDLHIASGSTVIGAGTNVGVTTDHDNESRSNPYDMGADEYLSSYSSPSLTMDPCAGSIGLPVQLLSFTATADDAHVDLKWSTASETNNDYFTIERSATADNFEKLFDVNGAGNSNSVLYYKTIDDAPLQGLSYYRLKQTDFDGAYSYSEIVPVFFGDVSDNGILNTWVDDSKNLNILFQSGQDDNIAFVIYNAEGMLVLSTEDKIKNGLNTFQIDAAGLASGLYILNIRSSQYFFADKFIVP